MAFRPHVLLFVQMVTYLYNDWFLPSKDELLLASRINGVERAYYWSSSESESNTGFAWEILLTSDNQVEFFRSSGCNVRPVRAF